jgi:hypothetical protein
MGVSPAPSLGLDVHPTRLDNLFLGSPLLNPLNLFMGIIFLLLQMISAVSDDICPDKYY